MQTESTAHALQLLAPDHPLALFGAVARRHIGLRVDVKSASRFDDLILVYALKVEREYGSIKSFCALLLSCKENFVSARL